ncbi:hypothetical protein KVF89_16340 [Nocardioides carbamazepini]|uniref:hypothetical protein n=1 Tax=Nocardioides carbamazepini TaxID=2854259 RepID=UPI00214A0DB2|nr:hypothetical protein [Nocardioides carbamazepini]MCR1784110.1 hypothetical protein [Nocardioides carbamazepini]
MSDGLLPEREPPEPSRRVRADALERAEQAWRMRTAGLSWSEVATRLGYSDRSNVIRLVREVFEELPEPDRTELRSLWRDRLERVWRQGMIDAHQQRPGAITALVRIAEAAMRLDGLNAPAEVVVHAPTEQELEAWVALVLDTGAPVLEEGDIFGA